mmetsp:Transcript_12533/g.19933  ORF Transcript_12533/g.19933 Transcript_12533/m.19933 type:complete len:503 (-) Transcript_12533:75-1583(-)
MYRTHDRLKSIFYRSIPMLRRSWMEARASTSRRKLSTSPAISTWFREVQEAAKRSISEGKRSGKSKGRYGGGELVRDFIGAELYAEDRGYFNATNCINTPREPLEFTKMSGLEEYQAHVKQLYYDGIEGWATPVEIFQPWYGQALARWIVGARQPSDGEELIIFELGAGNGTLARNILDYLQQELPSVYSTTRYITVDVSSRLAQIQAEKLNSHSDITATINTPASGLDEIIPKLRDKTVFVLGMEVLDNMPHDKIFFDSKSGETFQTHVVSDPTGHPYPYVEQLHPVKDPYIVRLANILSSIPEDISRGGSYSTPSTSQGGGIGMLEWARMAIDDMFEIFIPRNEAFLPSVCSMSMESIARCLPKHRIILADFAYLPDTISPALNSPVVSQKIVESEQMRGRSRDFDTYLIPQGQADIFFPTDFYFLEQMYKDVMSRARPDSPGVTVAGSLTHGAFFEAYADLPRLTTSNGDIPLLQDYSNMHVFVGSTADDRLDPSLLPH